MARYGMIVDVMRCTGCMTCVIACKQENLTGPGLFWNKVFEVESAGSDQIRYFRYGCMHCDAPPCAEACKEKAIYKNRDGIVLIDYDKCKDHKDCIEACPYGVMDIHPEETYFQERLPFEEVRDKPATPFPGKPSMCTFCIHRIEDGKEPACVEGCPSSALLFGDLDDPNSPVTKRARESQALLRDKGTKPKVTYITPEKISQRMEEKALETKS